VNFTAFRDPHPDPLESLLGVGLPTNPATGLQDES
jgi:hypothetical protein